jgi:MFS superfamily sulfate permease-like transporter
VGTEKADGNALQEFIGWITDISDWDRPSVLVGVLSLAVLVAMERVLPRVPAALVVVVASIIAAQALDLGAEGVALVGEVPTGFHFAPWSSVSGDQLIDMLPGALVIIVVGFAESLAVAKTYAAKHRETIDANQEMVAYGAANLGAGVLQGYSVSGSLSKSAAAEAAGAKSPLLMGVVSGAVLLTIAILAGVFEWLPEPTLAAIIIVAVAGMIDPAELKRLWDARAIDFALALGALLGVLVLDILGGVVVGVVLSLVLVIHRLDNPHVAILGTNQDATTYRELAENPEYKAVPGVLIYRFDAPLIFTNADFFKDDITQRVRTADPPYDRVVLDLEAVYEIDTTGLDALLQIKNLLDTDSITLDLARVKTDLRGMFDRMQVTDRLGPEHLHATIRDAITAAT